MVEVRYETSEPRRLVCLDARGPYAQVIGPTIGRLMQWVMPKGYSRGGPVYGIYHDSPQDTAPGELRCTIGVPAEPHAREEAEFYLQTLGPREEAVYVHKGPYDDLERVYGMVIGDIYRTGRSIAGPPMEVYLTDNSRLPPEEWVTEIRFPVSR